MACGRSIAAFPVCVAFSTAVATEGFLGSGYPVPVVSSARGGSIDIDTCVNSRYEYIYRRDDPYYSLNTGMLCLANLQGLNSLLLPLQRILELCNCLFEEKTNEC